MGVFDLIKKVAKLAAEYGPEVYELFEVLRGFIAEHGPEAIDLIKRIIADFQSTDVSILAEDYDSRYPSLATYCDGLKSEPSTAAIGPVFKKLIELIKNNPELITIIIGLLKDKG